VTIAGLNYAATHAAMKAPRPRASRMS
jgi:hypothetical protein